MKRLKLTLLLLLIAKFSLADDFCVKHLVVPNYPRLARIASLHGSVTIEFEISPEGHVLTARGSGNASKLLIKASETNIQLWTFNASSVARKPTTRHTITYVYKLEGGKQYDDSPPHVVFDLPDRIEITAHPYEVQTSIPSNSR